jgi:hypothetical protein
VGSCLTALEILHGATHTEIIISNDGQIDIEIQMTPYDLKYLKPFGSKSLVSPAGGCAKNNQSELDINFYCSKATMAIRPESGIKLKILA